MTDTDFSSDDPHVGWRVRLRLRTGKPLTTEDTSRVIEFEGREVTISSPNPEEALSKATWLIFVAKKFASEAEARAFGVRLRQAVVIAGLSSRLGVDVGLDRPTSWMSEEFARALGMIEPHERIAPNVHGIMVIPDDGATRFPGIEAKASVSADPAQVLGAIAALEGAPSLSPELYEALIVLNMAIINPQPIAQIVLAISVVEALGQDQEWSSEQRILIEDLALRAEDEACPSEEERSEVADALRRGLHKLSLRQGVMRIFSRFGLAHLKKEWDRVYGARSGLVHGTARLSESEISALGRDVIALCGTIILAMARHERVALPEVAAVHFPHLIME